MALSTLQTDHLVSSEKGLSSVSTLILGSKSAVLIDPPFLVPDAKAVVDWIKKKTSLPLKAVFVTHHHPDHYCPLQGDSVDHTLFWLPTERTVICGDAVYARSTHLWVEEVETPQLLDAWFKTLDLIEEGLRPEKVIPGHIEQGWELDAKADLAHARKYLQFFAEKVTYAKKKPGVDELYKTFKDAFPQAGKSLITYGERYLSALMGMQIRTLTSSLAICRINSGKAGRSGRRTSITMLVPGRRSSWRRITSLLSAVFDQYSDGTA
ncbi:hypothetical protein LTR12_006502 [Friedmanniomyces endolithicus]|nr:hypothetical protein LTR12_006502 [Friedmanniomyces endolithicus]